MDIEKLEVRLDQTCILAIIKGVTIVICCGFICAATVGYHRSWHEFWIKKQTLETVDKNSERFINLFKRKDNSPEASRD